VFVSYRRDDTPDATDRLTAELRDRIGAANVFLDIDDIDIGARFAKVVAEWVGRCDVLLAVIGPDWLDAVDDVGTRRLEDPTDYVRLEIEAAFARDIRVVPVLMHGARIPKRDELPDTLAPLVEYNAIELTRRHWEIDLADLVEGLRRITAPRAVVSEGTARTAAPRPTSEPATRRRRPVRRLVLAMAAVVAIAAVAVIVVIVTGGRGLTVTALQVGSTDGVAVGDGSVWLAGPGEVIRLEAASGAQVAQPIPDVHGPEAIAVGEGGVWVANLDGTVTRLDPSSGTVLAPAISVAKAPAAIAVGDHGVWAVSQLRGTVVRLSAKSGAPIGHPIDLGLRDPTSIAVGDGSVWVVGFSAQIARIDAATGRLMRPLTDSLLADAVAFGQGSFWVLNAAAPGVETPGSSVSRYDAAGNEIGSPVTVANTSLGMAVGLGSVWLTNSQANTVSRVVVGSDRVAVTPVPVGVTPNQIAAGDGAVWVVVDNALDWIRP
jgi:streptogramin lyase